MVRLREVPRTATFAWSPSPGKPLLVTGTRAGAVDADFSDESKLELWDLSLDDKQQGLELRPLSSIATESRYTGELTSIPIEETDIGLGFTISPGALPTLIIPRASLLALSRTVPWSFGTPRNSKLVHRMLSFHRQINIVVLSRHYNSTP